MVRVSTPLPTDYQRVIWNNQAKTPMMHCYKVIAFLISITFEIQQKKCYHLVTILHEVSITAKKIINDNDARKWTRAITRIVFYKEEIYHES